MLLDTRPYLAGDQTFARTYDISSDDSRFLLIKNGEALG
jgi:hypothetical protein